MRLLILKENGMTWWPSVKFMITIEFWICMERRRYGLPHTFEVSFLEVLELLRAVRGFMPKLENL
jgi:hypothetical protein